MSNKSDWHWTDAFQTDLRSVLIVVIAMAIIAGVMGLIGFTLGRWYVGALFPVVALIFGTLFYKWQRHV